MNRILNYPRSGSHYLQNLILNYSGNNVKFDHYLNNSDNDFIISIARDPFESIHSRSAMRKHYKKNINVDKLIEEYIETYDFLTNNANIVIDYNDLISYPEDITKIICNILGFKKNPMNYPAEEDSPSLNYLVSSKNVKEYEETYIKKENLEKCYLKYHNLLIKSISLT